ncbi:MAG: hypothetical protein HN826_11385 [Methylococcales bacterium]|jgi:hypothetical protein|nr:hypothetical protein [Methylococcales bacterium]
MYFNILTYFSVLTSYSYVDPVNIIDINGLDGMSSRLTSLAGFDGRLLFLDIASL